MQDARDEQAQKSVRSPRTRALMLLALHGCIDKHAEMQSLLNLPSVQLHGAGSACDGREMRRGNEVANLRGLASARLGRGRRPTVHPEGAHVAPC